MKPESSSPSPTGISPVRDPEPDRSVQGSYAHRKARAVDTQLTPQTRHHKKPFVSLEQRGIRVKKSTSGVLSWLAKGTVKIFFPIIISFAKRQQKAKRHFICSGIKKTEETIARLNDSTHQLEIELNQIKSSLAECSKALKESGIKESSAKEQQEYVQLLENYEQTIKALKANRASLSYFNNHLSQQQKRLTRFQQKAPKRLALMSNNVNSLLALLTGARSAYQALNQTKSHNVASEIELPPVYFPSDSGATCVFERISVVIDEFSINDHGELTLSIPQCKARATQDGVADNRAEAVAVEGAIKLTLRPPLGPAVAKLLTCGLSSIKSSAAEVLNIADDGSDLTDLIDLSFEHASLASDPSGKHNLITHSAVSSLLNLFSPQVRQYQQDQISRELMVAQSQCQELEQENRQDAVIEEHYQFLQESVLRVRESLKEQSEFRESLAQKQAEYEDIQHELMARKDERAPLLRRYQSHHMLQKSRLDALKSNKSSTPENLVSLFFHAREAMDANGSKTTPIRIAEQTVQVDTETEINFKNTHAELDTITLSPDGTLVVRIPKLSTYPTIHHKGQSQQSPCMNLEDIAITVSPPLGQLVYEASNVDLPITLAKLQSLLYTFKDSTTDNVDARGFYAPRRWSDYCSVSISQAGCSGHEKVKDNSETQAVDEQWVNSPLNDLLHHQLGMDQASRHRVLSALVLGLAEPQSQPQPQPEEEGEDEYFDALSSIAGSDAVTTEEKNVFELEVRPEDVFRKKRSILIRWLIGAAPLKFKVEHIGSEASFSLTSARVNLLRGKHNFRRRLVRKMIQKAVCKRRAMLISQSNRTLKLES